MPQFPQLKSGAVAHYPLRTASSFRTDVWEFIDGSEQRIPDFGSALKWWVIDLTSLDDQEVHAIAEFVH